MQNNSSRRVFLRAGVGLALSLTAGRLLARTLRTLPTRTALRTRHSVFTPEGEAALDKYREGVRRMKADNLNGRDLWTYYTNIHGAPKSEGKNPLWRQCQHGNEYFLPWHRWYVYFLEDILRGYVGDDFAMPFWPYQAGDGPTLEATRTLPRLFREPADPANPLFVVQRAATMNEGKPFPSTSAELGVAMTLPDFLSGAAPGFSSAIENLPHQSVHTAFHPGLMSDAVSAAADPIFFLHHANIDRLWTLWNARGHANPHEKTPTYDPGREFTFIDRTHQPASRLVKNCYDTAALGYVYAPVAGEALGDGEDAALASVGEQAGETVAHTTPTAPIQIGAATQQVALAKGQGAVEPPGKPPEPKALTRAVLVLHGVRADVPPGACYAVYVNLPSDAKPLTKAARPFLAGVVSFFGAGHQHSAENEHDEHAEHQKQAAQPAARTLKFDITKLLRRLEAPDARGDLATRLSISIVAYDPGTGHGASVILKNTVTIERVEVRRF